MTGSSFISSCPSSRQGRWGSERFGSFHEVRPLIMDRDRLPTGTPHPELVPTPPILPLRRYSALRDTSYSGGVRQLYAK